MDKGSDFEEALLYLKRSRARHGKTLFEKIYMSKDTHDASTDELWIGMPGRQILKCCCDVLDP